MSFARKRGPRMKNYQRTELDGYSFASKLEAALYRELKMRQTAGELAIERVQDHVYLSDARIGYKPDFRVQNLETQETEWHEAKGFESERWPILKKLWAAYGPGPLYIWKGSYTRLRLDETIIPKAAKALTLIAIAIATIGCTPSSAKPVRLNLIAAPEPTPDNYEWHVQARCPEPEPCVCETPKTEEEKTE